MKFFVIKMFVFSQHCIQSIFTKLTNNNSVILYSIILHKRITTVYFFLLFSFKYIITDTFKLWQGRNNKCLQRKNGTEQKSHLDISAKRLNVNKTIHEKQPQHRAIFLFDNLMVFPNLHFYCSLVFKAQLS